MSTSNKTLLLIGLCLAILIIDGRRYFQGSEPNPIRMPRESVESTPHPTARGGATTPDPMQVYQDSQMHPADTVNHTFGENVDIQMGTHHLTGDEEDAHLTLTHGETIPCLMSGKVVFPGNPHPGVTFGSLEIRFQPLGAKADWAQRDTKLELSCPLPFDNHPMEPAMVKVKIPPGEYEMRAYAVIHALYDDRNRYDLWAKANVTVLPGDEAPMDTPRGVN